MVTVSVKFQKFEGIDYRWRNLKYKKGQKPWARYEDGSSFAFVEKHLQQDQHNKARGTAFLRRGGGEMARMSLVVTLTKVSGGKVVTM